MDRETIGLNRIAGYEHLRISVAEEFVFNRNRNRISKSALFYVPSAKTRNSFGTYYFLKLVFAVYPLSI